MRNTSIWQRLLGLSQTVIESVDFDTTGDGDGDGEVLVVAIRPRKGAARRCGRCGRRAPRYDQGDGPRRWRHLDFGTVQVELLAHAPRVACPVHGPTVAAVPWARHGARHTTAFDDTVAWLAARTAASTVAELLRIT